VEGGDSKKLVPGVVSVKEFVHVLEQVAVEATYRFAARNDALSAMRCMTDVITATFKAG
jgi:hypothetical protein